MAPSAVPSREELDRRKIVGINAETVTDTTSTDFPGHFPGEDHAWDIDQFRRTFSIEIHDNTQHEASFSLIGIDASLANAFRRILIAEIPTLAIETIYMNNNTSVIQDEVLCHRLGLIPFKGGKDGLQNFMKFYKKPAAGESTQGSTRDWNTVEVRLNARCTHNRNAAKGERDPKRLYHNAHIYASDIKFYPVGRQVEYFSGENAIMPVYPDVLVAKLRPGQVIDFEAHMHKGTGADHAKYSPVATASYRLMPTITIMKPILGDDAKKFQECFPQGVVELKKVTKKEAGVKGSGYEGHDGEMKAVVVDPMRDTVSRECLRHDEFQGKVKLGRIRDHFIFSIESTGQWDSDELFLESIKILKQKCQRSEELVVKMSRGY